MKKKTNVLAIIGFVLSFFTFIIGFVISIIVSMGIDDTKEKGRGFARAGMIISSIKIIGAIVCVFMLSFVNPSYVGDKCKIAEKCELNEVGTYTCTFINDEGVEEYVDCETDTTSTEKKSSGEENSETTNDDTTDYDKE